ncbi:anti-sigma factor antagonist [Streptomyces sp. IBSBF 2953]|nr:anti-sigma factor antagonist [Streptomyces hayashii]
MQEPCHDADAGGVDARSGAEANGGARPRRTVGGPVIRARPEGDRVVVTVRGELDLDSTGQLERALRGALGAAVGGIDLELDDVAFCDCSALNVLLGARESGLEEGKTVAVHTVSPAVARLLDLTGTGPLFDAPGSTADIPGPTVHAPGRTVVGRQADAPDEGDVHDLRVEVARLRRALRTRPVIDLARGIVMASFGLGVEEARRVLALASRNAGAQLHHLARDLVRAVQSGQPAGAVHEGVAAAVATVRSRTAAAALDGGPDRSER